MKDVDFKSLNHPTCGDLVATRGSTVSPGYMPDVTVRDVSTNLTFILESEQKTDRKAFLGGLLKAEMYAEQQRARPTLVFVMQPLANTTTQQIADHLRPYIAWLASKQGGQLNLARVQVISDAEYLQAIALNECLASQEFQARGHVLLTAANTSLQRTCASYAGWSDDFNR